MRRVVLSGLLLVCWQADAQVEAPGPLEEVIVRVERPLGVLRAEAQLAERQLYEAFNSVLDEPDFEIECYEVTPTGSHIETEICEPAFVRRLRRLATQRAMDLGGIDHSAQQIDFAILRAAGNPEFDSLSLSDTMLDELVRLVNEDPIVQRAFLDYLHKQRVLGLAAHKSPRRRRRE